MLAPLVEKGQKDLVLRRYNNLGTSLHIMCVVGITDGEAISALLDVVRKYLVEATDACRTVNAKNRRRQIGNEK